MSLIQKILLMSSSPTPTNRIRSLNSDFSNNYTSQLYYDNHQEIFAPRSSILQVAITISNGFLGSQATFILFFKADRLVEDDQEHKRD